MFRTLRVAAALIGVAAGLVAVSDALAGDALTPPDSDGFSERVVAGIRLEVTPRGAAVAPDGTVHLVYGDTVLRHAWDDGSGWRTETLDGTHARGAEAVLAIDAAGKLHVAYGDPRRGEIYYGSDAGGTFASQAIASGISDSHVRKAIAIDSAGTVSVAWTAGIPGTLLVATGGATGFDVESVATDVGYGSDIDLALDTTGTPHVVFMAETPLGTAARGRRALVHAWRTASGWEREDVAGDDDQGAQGVGAAASLAFAADGELHVVYLGETDTSYSTRPLRHARFRDGAWESEIILTEPVVARTHTVITADGTLYVATLEWLGGVTARGSWGSWSTAALPQATSGIALAVGDDTVRVFHGDARGVYASVSRAGAAFETERLDLATEPLVRPSVAVDATGAPCIAIVRNDAAGAAIDVCRRLPGGTWDVGVAATGVAAGVRPSLRVDAAGAAHVAYVTSDGRTRCATDADGAWESVDVVSGLASAPTGIALAVGSDGSRHVLFDDTAAGEVVLASEPVEGGSPWDTVARDVVQTAVLCCDLGLSPNGALHAVWMDWGVEVVHASNESGAWDVAIVGHAGGGWGLVQALALAFDGAGTPWVALSVPWQFESFSVGLTPGEAPNGLWDGVDLGAGVDPAIGFDASGRGVAVGRADGVVRARQDPDGWHGALLDVGPGALREFAGADVATVIEGGDPVDLAVRTAPLYARLGDRAGHVAAAVDVAGAVHAAYIDRVTGDLRYVTDRDPHRPVAGTLSLVVEAGTAESADIVVSPAILSLADDDSGVRHVSISAVADGTYEDDESLVLRLAALSGPVGVGSRSGVTVVVQDPGEHVPPPTPAPEPIDGPYLLATRARVRGDGTFAASGLLHVFPAEFDPAAGGVLALGATARTIPALEFGGRWWVWNGDDGSRLRLRTTEKTPGVWEFDCQLAPTATDPDWSEPFELALTAGQMDARCRLGLERRRLDLRRGVGYFDRPAALIETLSVQSGTRGSVRCELYVPSLGERPATPPAVTVAVAPIFAASTPASAFRRTRVGYVSRRGPGRIVLDYRRGRIVATFPRASVSRPVFADAPVTLSIDLGDGPITVPTMIHDRAQDPGPRSR